ncbi:MAG: hypothetical protein ACM3ZF_07850 [Mycobacterium leprae]
MDTDPLIARRVWRFLDRLPRNLHLYSSGLVYHDVGDLFGRLTNRPVSRLRRQLLAIARHTASSSSNGSIRLHDPRYRKAIGYHGFNLYAFAMLRQHLPRHPFWSSGTMRRVIAYTDTDEYREGLESNKYGYPYNSAGFEVAFALHVFADLAAPAGRAAGPGVGPRTAAPHVRRRAAPAGPQHGRPDHAGRPGVRGHPAAGRRDRGLTAPTYAPDSPSMPATVSVAERGEASTFIEPSRKQAGIPHEPAGCWIHPAMRPAGRGRRER